MSQSNSDATDSGTVQNNDSSPDSLQEQVTAMHERLDALEPDEIEDMDDLDLVELRTEIKELEDTVDEVRSDVVDAELEDRIEVGESLYGLSRIESHNKYLAEDAGKVIMRAVGQGIDYTEFVSVNASALASEHPDLAEVKRAEYTYLR